MRFLKAISISVIFYLTYLLSPQIPALASPSPDPAAKGWTCRGPVTGCTSPKHPGAQHGCSDEIGHGDTEGSARRSGAERCEARLEATHGGGFFCRDTDAMQCQESEDPNGAPADEPMDPSSPRAQCVARCCPWSPGADPGAYKACLSKYDELCGRSADLCKDGPPRPAAL